MAGRAKKDRLSPPLMYAFREAHRVKDAAKKIDARDSSGTRILASRRSRASITEVDLRNQLARDLESLLNTINMDAAIPLEEFPAAKISIINYGLPELSSWTIDELDDTNVPREIEATLLTHEPRLIRGTIRVKRDNSINPDSLQVRFNVVAEMSCDPVALPVEFVADLEVASGKVILTKR